MSTLKGILSEFRKMLDVIMSLLKYAAVILTGGLGVVTLAKDFKYDAGDSTSRKRLRRLVLLTVLSGFLALGIQVAEFEKAKRSEQAAANEATRLLKTISETLDEARRVRTKFDGLDVEIVIELPATCPSLAEYAEECER